MRMSVEKQEELRRAAEREGLYDPSSSTTRAASGFVAHIKGVQLARDRRAGR